ncbi:CirA Outer membrane receptor proteins, mostly Fe transport [Methylophilaceae bacterium]
MKKALQPKLIVVAILAAYAMPHAAWAANKAEALELGKVEVVGTTPLAGVGVPVEQVPSNVQVVKGSEIQNQQSLGVADFMNQNLSGVNINEAQNNPYQPDVNFRGFTASPLVGTPQGLSVYQDGVRINEPFGDTVNWDLIPQNAISSMTLMPGSNPLFGLNTLGGALSVQTKSGEHYPGGGLQVLGGSFGRWAVEGEYGGKTADGVSYFFAGNRFEENGWRDASPSDVLQGFAKLGWSNEKTDVDISFSGADTDLTGNGYQAQTLLGQAGGYDSIYTKPDNTQNQLSFVNSKVSHWLSDELLLTTNAYFRRNKTKTLNGDVNDEYETLYDNCNGWATTAHGCDDTYDQGVNNRSNSTNKSFGGTVQTSWVNDRNLLITGMSIDLGRVGFTQTEQEADSFNATRGFDASVLSSTTETAVDLSAKSRTWSLFATDTFAVTPKLAFTVSARYNDTHLNVTDKLAADHEGTCMVKLTGAVVPCDSDGMAVGQFVTLSNSIATSSNLASGTHRVVSVAGGDAGGTHNYRRLNPAVGMTYAFTPETNTYLGYNEGSRAPSPIETGCADPLHPCLLPNAMAGDPPLQQVVAKTFEGGVRGKLGQDTRWSLGAYRAVNHNDLQFIASGTTGAGYFDNVGKTRRQGLDFALNSKLGNFSWAAGYSLIDATYQTPFAIASEANSSRVDITENGITRTVIQVSKGDKMAGIAKHQFKLRGQWQATPNWSIGTTGVAFSDQYARGNENNKHVARTSAEQSIATDTLDDNAYSGSGKVKGYAIFNLDTRYNFNASGWQLFGKVNNVFDRKYYSSGMLGENSFNGTDNAFAANAASTKEMFLAPGAPRAAWIGMRYDFGKPKGIAAAANAD